jgi:hypothetical protein
MMYTTLDKVVKGYLLQRKFPIHWYIDFLMYCQRGLEEISMDSIGNIRTVKLTLNSYGSVAVPTDYMDWVKIGVPVGQYVRPLNSRGGMNPLNNYTNDRFINSLGPIVPGSGYHNATFTNVPLTGGTGTGATANITVSGTAVTAVTMVNKGSAYSIGDVLSTLADNLGGTGSGFSVTVLAIDSSEKIPFADDFFSSVCSDYWWNGPYGFGYYGSRFSGSDSFEVVPERNEIQFNNNVNSNDIILEYISDGSSSDNATQITPYAKATLEAYINWKYKENNRSYGEGERQRAQRQFEHQHTILRARVDPITMSDIKRAIYRNTTLGPK